MAANRENPIQAALAGFADYGKSLKGDEKGEAQVFCDRLFQAFGHAGFHEAGATLEHRVRNEDKRTKFVDCLWPGKLLIEMKKRGEKLQRHYSQAFQYWTRIVPHRPQYVILCNFDEFWIYDFNKQLDEPMDRVALSDLPHRYDALNFLLPRPKTPNFRNDLVAVTQSAADKVSRVFNQLIERESRELSRTHDKATAEALVRVPIQRFVLQCVIAMFSEDAGLLPKGLFSELLNDCLAGQSSYDLLGGLFRQMNTEAPARGGRYANVRYFNGGLFAEVEPYELTQGELFQLQEASREDWSKVKPSIFGTLFQSSMGKAERHSFGAHYTSEADIQKVVGPTIVQPWRERIAATSKLEDLRKLRSDLLAFRVLDPACGSGNFLYVAFREMVRLEMEIIGKVHEKFGADSQKSFGTRTEVSPKQFFGLDVVPFAVELAKVTLMIGRQLALNETRDWFRTTYSDQAGLEFDPALPLDNLDENIQCSDALFTDWPEADAIIGNPPFQSKNKAQKEMGPAYLQRIRAAYPKVPGRADFCVYWFHKAHQVMKPNSRAGLVGTNTIRQNYSREGSLDFIVNNGGTITDAVSSQVWSGDAAVHVSIVNWVKGHDDKKKHLSIQAGTKYDSPWDYIELDLIPSSLTSGVDLTKAKTLGVNKNSDSCYQGQTHGNAGFLRDRNEAEALLESNGSLKQILKPYLIGDELLGQLDGLPTRYVIDFQDFDVIEAAWFKPLFDDVKESVLPARELAAKDEIVRNKNSDQKKVNHHHAGFLKRWWQLAYPRRELIQKIRHVKRYAACSRVTMRQILEFVDSSINPNDQLQVFLFEDDYSFGILASTIHWKWFLERCSTLGQGPRYTSESVFNSFPWPQMPTNRQIENVAAAAVSLRALRKEIMAKHSLPLRELYRTLETPGTNPLRTAHEALDKAVREAYGMKPKDDILAFLLKLNHELAEKESRGESIQGPGLPASYPDPAKLVTDDCIRVEERP